MKKSLLPLLSAILTIAIVGVALSLTGPLIAMRMETAGFSGGVNGVGAAMAGVATLIAAPLTPSLVARMGVKGALLAALIIGIVSLTGLTFIDAVYWWFPLRFSLGVSSAILFVVSEYSVSALAPLGKNGLWIGLYSTALGLAFAAGPLALAGLGADGRAAYYSAIALFVLAGAPAVLMGANPPTVTANAKTPIIALLARAPVIMLAALVFGVIESSILGLLPVFALRNGYDARTGALFVAIASLGSVLFQMPLGLLADRLNRRTLLAAITTLGFCGACGLIAMTHYPAAFCCLLFLWGGNVGCLYMIGLSDLSALYRGADLAAANAAFVTFYAFGMLIGPPLLGAALDQAPHYGLFAALAAVLALYLAVMLAFAQTGHPKNANKPANPRMEH